MSLIDRILKAKSHPRNPSGQTPPPAAAATGQPEEGSTPGSESPAATEKPAPAGAESPLPLSDLDQILDAVDRIDDAFKQEQDAGRPGDTVLSLPLPAVLSALPASLLSQSGRSQGNQGTVEVKVPDLADQLAAGKVEIGLSSLADALPPGYLAAPSPSDAESKVALPLAEVVAAVPQELFSSRLATPEREVGLAGLPDPFAPARDAGAEPDPGKGGEDAASRAGSGEQVPSPEPPARPAVPPAPAAIPPEPAAVPPEPVAVPSIMVKDIDLNRAGGRELVKRLPGVGPKTAAAIIDARPFNSAYGLLEIPGMGRRQFFRITGEHPPAGGSAADEMNRILGPAGQPLPPMQEIASRIASLKGVGGCLLCHAEGHLLAAAGAGRKYRSFGAIAPQILKGIEKYLALLKLESPSGLTVFTDPRPIHVTRYGNLLLIVTIPRTRCSIRRINLLENLAAEIVRRLRSGENVGETTG